MEPQDFIYTLPEGYEFKPEHRNKIDVVMAKLGADNETAQELINIHVEIVEAYIAELNAPIVRAAEQPAKYMEQEELKKGN